MQKKFRSGRIWIQIYNPANMTFRYIIAVSRSIPTQGNVPQRKRHRHQFGQRERHPILLLLPNFTADSAAAAIVELGVMNCDEQITKQWRENGQWRRNLVPLRAGHLDAARNDGQEAGRRAKERGLGSGAYDLPQLTQESRPEGQRVEQGVVVKSLQKRFHQ